MCLHVKNTHRWREGRRPYEKIYYSTQQIACVVFTSNAVKPIPACFSMNVPFMVAWVNFYDVCCTQWRPLSLTFVCGLLQCCTHPEDTPEQLDDDFRAKFPHQDNWQKPPFRGVMWFQTDDADRQRSIWHQVNDYRATIEPSVGCIHSGHLYQLPKMRATLLFCQAAGDVEEVNITYRCW